MKEKKVYLFMGLTILVIIIGLAVVYFTSVKDDSLSSDNSESGDVAGVSTQDSVKDQEWVEGLAKTLTEKGMVMYGAYWCSHCNNQKKMFGESVKYIDYVECDPSGENANPDECKANEIEGYPTWVYQGEQYPGEKSLEKLAEIIGYK